MCSADRIRLISVIVALIAPPSLPLGAQEGVETGLVADDTVVALSRFEISGARETDYASVLSLGGTKTASALVETPQAISVITRFQIEDQAAQTMSEVLRYTAGVRAETYGVDNRGDWFALRGGSEGSTVLDGLRLPITGSWGSVRNEPFAFERVEVLRGPSSVLYGQNGPGGLVNLVSKLPQHITRGEVQVQYGTNDHRLAAFDTTGPLTDDGRFLYRVVGLAKDANTQVDHASEQRKYLAPSVTWKISSDAELTAYVQYQKDESDNTNAFLPWSGTLLPAPLGPVSDALFVGEPAWDTYGGQRYRFGHQFEQRLTSQWTLRHHFRYDDVEGHLLTMYANWWEGYLNDRALNRTWYAAEYDHCVVTTDVLLEGRFTTGELEHTVLIGADGYWSRHDDLSIEGAATPLDVYAPVYGTFARPELDYGPANRTRTRQLGMTLQDQIKILRQWVVVGSLRRDEVDNSGQDDSAWSSRLGVVYLGSNGLSPYLSYAESFESVSGADAYGAPYKPKRGEQLELGLKWAPKESRIAAAAALYTLKENNRLTTDPQNPLNSIQRGEVTVNGVELESTAKFGSLSIVGNYTFTDAEVSGSSDPQDPYLNHRLTSIPEHSAALWGVYSFSGHSLQGLRLGLGVRYVGETWDGTDTVRTPSNTLYDALISYDRGRWHYALNATNVLDEKYIAASLDRGDSWFGSRRKVIATIGYRW